jgi:hypothetical protein
MQAEAESLQPHALILTAVWNKHAMGVNLRNKHNIGVRLSYLWRVWYDSTLFRSCFALKL